MNPETKITLSEDALSQVVNGETVILDLKSEQYFGLDEVGTRIWQLLEEHGDLQKTLDTMLEEFDVDEDRLKKDLDTLIDKMKENGLLHFGESTN